VTVINPSKPGSGGFVKGPVGATSGDLASFNGASGDLIADSGIQSSSVVSGSSAGLASRPSLMVGLYGGSAWENSEVAGLEAMQAKLGTRPLDIGLYFSGSELKNPMYGGQYTFLKEIGSVLPMVGFQPHKTLTSLSAANITMEDKTHLEEAATQMRAYGAPVLIRLCSEFNGNWNTYYGDTKEEAKGFVEGWQNVVKIFREKGAHNALFVWDPNVWGGANTINPLVADSSGVNWFPGDAYVDYLGLDGYWKHGETYTTPSSLFMASYEALCAASKRPLIICETGCDQRVTGGQAKWFGEEIDMVHNEMQRCVAINFWLTTSGEEHLALEAGANTEEFQRRMSSPSLVTAPGLSPLRTASQAALATSEERAAQSYFPGVVIADRTWVTAYDGVLGGFFRSNSAIVYTARVACSDLRPMFFNENADSLTELKDMEFTCALEYPIGAARTPFYFNKKRTVILSPGAAAFADPHPAEIPAGAEFAIWVYGKPNGSGIFRGPGAVYSGLGGYTNGDRLDLGATSLSVVDSGTITNTEGNAGGMQAPQAVFGQAWSPSRKKLARIPQPLIIGDSISEGHTGIDRLQRRNPGWVNEWMVAHNVAHINVAKSGETAQAWGATQANQTCRLRQVFFGAATAVLYAEGVNDIAARTALQIETDMLACAAMAHTRNLAFYPCTITPLASSTDSFLTVTNQTANSNTVRTEYNEWLRAGAPISATTKLPVAIGTEGALLAGSVGHPVTEFVEVAYLVESAHNSGKWAAAGASGTASFTNGSTSITGLTTATGEWKNGDYIIGSGIPALTVLSNVNIGAGTATMSYKSTAEKTNTAVSSPLTPDGTHPSQTGVGLIVAGLNIPTGLIA